MGQSASKAVKPAIDAAKSVASASARHQQRQRPPIGPPPPASASGGQSTTTTPDDPASLEEMPEVTPGGKKLTDVNPGSFLRGDGLATQDVRDVVQEMYLKEKHKLGGDDNDEISSDGNNVQEQAQTQAKNVHEMPDDLLKFIQDVGPAKQVVDREQTSPRLLEEENVEELQKLESQRKQSRRGTTRMPLMGEDTEYTTTRSTNFAKSAPEVVSDEQQRVKDSFGITNVQMFDLLNSYGRSGKHGRSSNDADTNLDVSVDNFYKKLTTEAAAAQEGSSDWSDEEINQQKRWLQQCLQYLEVPVLRQDPDGNFIGLYSENVPGGEVKTLQPVSPTKVKLVLDDILSDGGGAIQTARDNLAESRKARIKEQSS